MDIVAECLTGLIQIMVSALERSLPIDVNAIRVSMDCFARNVTISVTI